MSAADSPPQSTAADPAALAARVKEAARAAGATLAGIADPRRPILHAEQVADWTRRGRHGPMAWWPRGDAARLDPCLLMPSARSLLMVAVTYDGHAPLPDPPAPRVSRYALGRDYHKVLKRLLRDVVQRLEHHLGPLAWRACVDTAPLLERYWAWQAGLGWIGKNSLLIHPRHGSWLFLGGLLLDLELAADTPHAERCGRCEACLHACPTTAFLAPGLLDAGRCISAQTIENRGKRLPDGFAPMPGAWLFGCDDCQTVCPWNRRAGSGATALAPDPALLERMARGDWPADDGAWDLLTRGKALRRMTPEMYRRNLVACGRARAEDAGMSRAENAESAEKSGQARAENAGMSRAEGAESAEKSGQARAEDAGMSRAENAESAEKSGQARAENAGMSRAEGAESAEESSTSATGRPGSSESLPCRP